MRLEQLYYLVEISKNKSLNRSSQILHISHQGLSNAIRSLEDELGFTVLTRTPRGVALTAKGEILVDATKTYLRVLAELSENPLAAQQKLLPDTYTLAASHGATYVIMPMILAYLRRELPNIDFHLAECTAEQCRAYLLNEQCEFALIDQSLIRDIPAHLPDDLLAFAPLSQHKLYLSAHEKFAITRYQSVSLKSLLNYPLIIQCHEHNQEHSLLKIIRHFGQPQKVYFESNWPIIQEMVAAGVGITLATSPPTGPLPASFAPNVKNLPISDPIKITYGYLHLPDHQFSTVAATMLDYIRQSLQ